MEFGRKGRLAFDPVGKTPYWEKIGNGGLATRGGTSHFCKAGQSRAVHMTGNTSALASLLDAIIVGVEHPSASQGELLDRLSHYRDRLKEDRFQLAVLGQFKRGKSTLLNAMIGRALLAADILPVTAIPTFLSGGPSLGLTLIHCDGSREEIDISDFDDLVDAVAAATTEERNPGNRHRFERVDVTIPGNRWLDAVTLIDTPGVGSTHSHNTGAAQAVLPECDAALFVLSVDLPITDVEVKYLKTVCETVSCIVIVLNKIDLLEEETRQRASLFLRSVLEKEGLAPVEPNLFPLSARDALAARLRNDADGVKASGLWALEDFVRNRLVGNKRLHLETSSVRNALILVGRLVTDLTTTLAALTLPLSELDWKIALFESAVAKFHEEHQVLNDLLTGEWRRTLVLLDGACAEAETTIRGSLSNRLDAALDSGRTEESQRLVIHSAMTELCDAELRRVTSEIQDHVDKSINLHRRDLEALAARVANAAAGLMQVSGSAVVDKENFRPLRLPYWSSRERAESIGAVTGDWLALLLPRKLRQRRLLRKLRDSAFIAVGRNTAALHWSIHQNIDDSFRRLVARYDKEIENSILATRTVLDTARSRRQAEDVSVQEEVFCIERSLHNLERARTALEAWLASDYPSWSTGVSE